MSFVLYAGRYSLFIQVVSFVCIYLCQLDFFMSLCRYVLISLCVSLVRYFVRHLFSSFVRSSVISFGRYVVRYFVICFVRP